MILTFRHKGLREFFLSGNTTKTQQNHINKLRLILANLNASVRVENMNLPGLDLHRLYGDRLNFWLIRVNGNWRIVFRFENGDAHDVDYLDYH